MSKSPLAVTVKPFRQSVSSPASLVSAVTVTFFVRQYAPDVGRELSLVHSWNVTSLPSVCPQARCRYRCRRGNGYAPLPAPPSAWSGLRREIRSGSDPAEPAARRQAPPALRRWRQLCRDLLCGVCRHFLRQRVEESLCCRVGLRSFLRLVQQFAVGAASIGGLGLRLLRAVAANAPGGSRDRHRGWTMSQLNKRFFIGLLLRSLPLSGGVPGWGLLSFLLTIALLRRFAANFAGNVGFFCLKCTVPPPQCAGCSLSQRSFFV